MAAITSKKAIRIVLAIILMLSFAVSLSACGKDASATKKGGSLSITYDEIEKEGREGIFVLNRDESFTPILADMPGFSGETDKADLTRFVWYTDNKTNITGLIPTVTPGTPLVAIYDSTEEMPAYWYLEKYKDKGYTIGAHIYLTEEKAMRMVVDDTLASSSAEARLTELAGKDEEYTIDWISGTSNNKLPIDNVDNNIYALLGFDKDKLFTFKIFRGTKTEQMDIYADTHIFQSVRYIELNNPFKKTSKGYFIINLPLNLADGYYYLSDIGFFRYQK